MSLTTIKLAYLLAAVLFVFGLKFMAHPRARPCAAIDSVQLACCWPLS